MKTYEYIKAEITDSIAIVTLNNPKKTNAINEAMWGEIKLVFDEVSENNDVKACIVKSDAKHFSSGIDVGFLGSIMERLENLPADQRGSELYKQIKKMQESMNAIQDCRVPVIAAVHGICVGGAVDLIGACDIRLSTYSAVYSIMETKLGIVADMGTLQRLTRIVSDTHLKEYALTSDFFSGFKAKKINLVNKNYLTKAQLHKAALKLAHKLADLPSNAVCGTKETINFARDNSITDGLDQIAKLNSNLLLSEETRNALAKVMNKLKKKS